MKISLKKYSIAICFFAPLINAAPTITAADIEAGADKAVLKLVINGTNFGAGPELVYYNNFNQYKLGSAIDKVISSDYLSLPGTTEYSYSSGPMVNIYKGKQGFEVVNPTDDSYKLLKIMLNNSYEEIFLSYAVTIPEGHTAPNTASPKTWKGSSWKMSWLLQDGSSNSDANKFDLCVPTQVSDSTYLSGNASKFMRISKGDLFRVSSYSLWWQWGDFNYINYWMKKDASNNATPNAHFSTLNKQFGLQQHDIDPTAITLSGPDISISQINMPGWVKNIATDNFQALYDDIYIAAGPHARARVEITDNPLYSASHMRIPIPAIHWTADEIHALVNKQDISNTTHLYIHVFDADAGSVKMGKEICLSCPKAPPNFKIISE